MSRLSISAGLAVLDAVSTASVIEQPNAVSIAVAVLVAASTAILWANRLANRWLTGDEP